MQGLFFLPMVQRQQMRIMSERKEVCEKENQEKKEEIDHPSLFDKGNKKDINKRRT